MESISTVDEILPYIGEIGLHQVLVMAILCIILIPGGFQALNIYFLADNPSWRCVANSTKCTMNGSFKSGKDNYTFRCGIPREDWEYVEGKYYSIVTQFELNCDNENLIFVATSIMFAGMAIGSIVIGWAADRYGRVKLMIPCTVVALLTAFASSFFTSYWLFIISRFIIGLLAPGIIVMYFIVASEMVGPRYRPVTGIVLWMFFTLSLVILGIVAMYVREWKYLMIYSTAPYFILFPLLFLIPESLRWLHITGQLDKAHRVIKTIAKINGFKEPTVHLAPAKVTNHNVNPILLFSSTRTALRSLNIGFAWMVNGLVYYGISFAASDLSGQMYRDYILSSLVEFPAAVGAILGTMYIGRKQTTQYPLFTGGLFCAAVSGIHELETRQHMINLRVACGLLGKLFLTMSYDSIYTWTVELYPTQIRTEAIGYVQITSRVGAMLAPWIAKWLRKFHWRIPFAVMGMLAIIAAVLLQCLPETRGQKTPEVLEDTKENDNNQELQLVTEETTELV